MPADFGWAKSGSTVASSYIDELRGPLSNALLLVVNGNVWLVAFLSRKVDCRSFAAVISRQRGCELPVCYLCQHVELVLAIENI